MLLGLLLSLSSVKAFFYPLVYVDACLNIYILLHTYSLNHVFWEERKRIMAKCQDLTFYPPSNSIFL